MAAGEDIGVEGDNVWFYACGLYISPFGCVGVWGCAGIIFLCRGKDLVGEGCGVYLFLLHILL